MQSLSQYLRGEKAEIANPTAAWSSQTGKGLLYFVKHADEKATPAGVLNLVRTDTRKTWCDKAVTNEIVVRGYRSEQRWPRQLSP